MGSGRLGIKAAFWAVGIGAFGAGIAIPTAVAAQVGAAQDRPGAAELRNALRRLSANPRDLDALIDAGTASLQLGDTSGAVDFFTRAEAVAPNNGDVKVGLGTAMLRQENPVEAIRLFDEAEKLGMPTRSFALDRGLAYDLVGDFVSAERQYQIAALSGPSDDITLRRGISLGVQGREMESLKLMDPLLSKNDPGAWRAQAFIYAANGDMTNAHKVAVSFLGEQKAQAMRPYFERMPLLTPAQKMAAIHFGHFPTTNIGQDSPQIAAMSRAPSSDRLTPQGQPLGPNKAQSGSAEPPASTAPVGRTAPRFIDFKGRPQKDVRYTLPVRESVRVAEASPAPQPELMPKPALGDGDAGNRMASTPSPAIKANASDGQPSGTDVRNTSSSEPKGSGATPPSPATLPSPAFQTVPTRTVAGAPVPGNLPSGYQPSVPAAGPIAAPPSLPPAGYSETAGTYVDSQGVTRRIGEDGSTNAVVAANSNLTNPAGGTQSTAEQGATVLLPPVEAATNVSPAPMGGSGTTSVRPSLTAVVGSVPVPDAEKDTAIVPVTPEVIANTPGAVPPPRVVTPKSEASKPDPAKATPKAANTAPAAKSAPKQAQKSAEKPAASHPKRFWVQIATGYDTKALTFEYNKAARANPALFKGVKGYSAKQGKSLRLVVGPFSSSAEAKAWEKKWLAADGQGFAWQSEEGTVVDPLPSR